MLRMLLYPGSDHDRTSIAGGLIVVNCDESDGGTAAGVLTPQSVQNRGIINIIA